jgi:hypothetical protein
MILGGRRTGSLCVALEDKVSKFATWLVMSIDPILARRRGSTGGQPAWRAALLSAYGVMQLVLVYGHHLLLKAILIWYKDADSRCRHEIFGNIFFLTFGISTVWPHEEFPADDAEQAFVANIEHPGS